MKKQDYWKFLARTQTFQEHERQKFVYAESPSVLLFLIRKLHDLTSSCPKKN